MIHIVEANAVMLAMFLTVQTVILGALTIRAIKDTIQSRFRGLAHFILTAPLILWTVFSFTYTKLLWLEILDGAK